MDSAERKLSVLDLTIKTASVQVKTLTLNGKQLTLSVFKQIPSREFHDRMSGARQGIPWGFVKYHTKKCRFGGVHLHLIWQQESQLFQCCVYVESVPHKMPDEEWFKEVKDLFRLDQLFIAV